MGVADDEGLDAYAPGFVEACGVIAETMRSLNEAVEATGVTPEILRMAASTIRTGADEFERLAASLEKGMAETEVPLIVCRAKLSAACYDGAPTTTQFGEPDEGEEPETMAGDGTFDGESIVCDACYMVVMANSPSGRGLHHEINPTIERVRASRGES